MKKRTLSQNLLLSLKGMGMGAADVVPGVSGGRRGRGRRGQRPEGNGGGHDFDIDEIMNQSLHRRTRKPVIMLGGDMRGRPGPEADVSVMERIRQQLVDDGVPTVPSMTRAANALGKLIDFYDYKRKWANFA